MNSEGSSGGNSNRSGRARSRRDWYEKASAALRASGRAHEVLSYTSSGGDDWLPF